MTKPGRAHRLAVVSSPGIAWTDESLAPDGKRDKSIVVFDLDNRTSRTVATAADASLTSTT